MSRMVLNGKKEDKKILFSQKKMRKMDVVAVPLYDGGKELESNNKEEPEK